MNQYDIENALLQQTLVLLHLLATHKDYPRIEELGEMRCAWCHPPVQPPRHEPRENSFGAKPLPDDHPALLHDQWSPQTGSGD